MKSLNTLFLILLLMSVPAADLFALEIGVAPAARKILPDTPMPELHSAELFAAQNEWEAFQIVLRSDTPVGGIDVKLSDFIGPEGAIIQASNAILYREYYLNVTNESSGGMTYHERLPGLYPDPLIPFEDPWSEEPRRVGAPFDLATDETGVVFVDIHVPEDVPRGLYAGTATVLYGGEPGETVEIPVALTVWEFTIPKERTVATAFGYSRRHGDRYHGGQNGERGEEFLQMVDDRYINALHDHRMDLTHLKGPVEYNFDENGELLPVDWTAYDAYMEPYMTGSRFSDGIGQTRFDVSSFRPGSGQGSLTDDQWAAEAQAFAEHLVEKGWWDKAYVYATDEPWLNGGEETWNQIKYDTDLLRRDSGLWDNKTLITGAYQEIVREGVGIWCPVTPMYEDWFYHGESMAGREEYAELMAEGKELWFYVCNANMPPYAGYDIDTAIGYEPRIVKWGTWYEGATGFLFWRTNYWVEDDPWNVFLNIPQFTELMARNGDGFLFYPGDHNGPSGKGSPDGISIDGPILSYRMKQIRDGLEDWEMFRLLDAAGGGEYLRSQVERTYSRFGDFTWESCDHEGFYCPDDQPWTIDENVLLDARANIAAKLLYLMYPDRYDDPEYAEVDGDDDGDEDGDEDSEIEDGDIEDGDAEDGDIEDGDIVDGDAIDGDATPPEENSGDSGCAGIPSALPFALLSLAAIWRRRR